MQIAGSDCRFGKSYWKKPSKRNRKDSRPLAISNQRAGFARLRRRIDRNSEKLMASSASYRRLA